MRTITVERRKSKVGALGTFSIYVEDYAQQELLIRAVPCRFVGKIKNGEELRFELDETERRIFVVNGKTSKDFCLEMLRLPAGNSDVTLSGQCRFSIATGNAFRFDDNDTEETRAIRKSAAKTGILAIILTAVLTPIAVVMLMNGQESLKSCFKRASDKSFAVQEMTITLDSTFEKDASLGFAGYLNSAKAGVFVERAGFDEFEESEGLDELTADQFAMFALLGGAYGDDVKLQQEDGIPFIEFSDTDSASGEPIRFLIAFYKSDKAFWDVQFVSLEKDYARMRPSFLKWAKSVTFE